MRELLALGVIDFIISTILILLKIFGILLWSWVTLAVVIFLSLPITIMILFIIIMIIIYNNTK
jgi:hypothetical protein|nr:MAG TPA: hypothetical protein [Bacteriophage sp.]